MASTLENNGNLVDSEFLSSKGPLDGRIRDTKIDRRYMFDTFGTGPFLSAAAPETGAAVSATTDRVVGSAYNLFRVAVCGGNQALLAPFKAAGTGWDISHDLTNNDEIEMFPAGALSTDCPQAYTVGTDAAFFFRVKLTVADASGAELLQIGFRKQAAVTQAGDADPPTLGDYTDYAVIGLRGTSATNLIKIATNINNGGETLTDTTMTWADAAQKILMVKVSSAGVITYEVNGAAPTATASATFDTGDVMIPFLKLVHGSDVGNGVVIDEWECGLLPSSRTGQTS